MAQHLFPSNSSIVIMFVLFVLVFITVQNCYGLLGKYEQLQQQEDDTDELHEAKVSRICSFVARTCTACVQLEACFWCESNIGKGACLANINQGSGYKCLGHSVYSDSRFCIHQTSKNITYTRKQQDVLLKLLYLLRKLQSTQDSPSSVQNNKYINNYNIKNNKIANNKTLKNKAYINTKSQVLSEIDKSLTTAKEYHPNKFNKLNTTSNFGSTNSSTEKAIIFDKNIYVKNVCHSANKSTCDVLFCTWSEEKHTCEKAVSRTYISTRFTTGGAVEIGSRCGVKRTCGICVSDSKCYWCDRSKSCHTYPEPSFIPVGCHKEWHHRRCGYRLTVLIITIPSLCVVAFLGIAYVCIRNCYYHQKKPVEVKLEEQPILFKLKNGKTVYQITESEEEDEDERYLAEKSGSTYQKIGKNQLIW